MHGRGCLAAWADVVRALSASLVRAAHVLSRAEDAAGDAFRVLLATAGHAAGERPLGAVIAAVVLARVALPGLAAAGVVAHLAGDGPAARRWLATTDPAEHAVAALAGVVRGLGPGVALPHPAPVPGAARTLVGGMWCAAWGLLS